MILFDNVISNNNKINVRRTKTFNIDKRCAFSHWNPVWLKIIKPEIFIPFIEKLSHAEDTLQFL